MDPSIRRFSDATAFLEHVQPLLLRNEAENNLILGVVRTLIDQPDRYAGEPVTVRCVTCRSISSAPATPTRKPDQRNIWLDFSGPSA